MLITIFHILTWALFIYFAFSSVYLLCFAIAGKFLSPAVIPPAILPRNATILIPAYKEDAIIIDTVQRICTYKYHGGRLRIVVIADHLKATTLTELQILPVTVLISDLAQSSKARAIHFGLSRLNFDEDGFVVLLDADNLLQQGSLERINDAIEAGFKAVQVHRTAKNSDTPLALLDAISEEINLNIFRRGAYNLGLSAMPMGSGMAFTPETFANIFGAPETITSVAEDRQVENYLIMNSLRMAFIDEAIVYDEKVSSRKVFENQRQRWMEAQLNQLNNFSRQLWKGKGKSTQFYYSFLQTFLLPRVIYLCISFLVLAFLLVQNIWGLRFLFPAWQYWLFVVAIYWLVLLISVPGKFYQAQTVKAVCFLPALMVTMLLNLFKLKKNRKEFLHTNKNYVQKD